MGIDVLSYSGKIKIIKERAYSYARFPLPLFKSMLVMLPFSRNLLIEGQGVSYLNRRFRNDYYPLQPYILTE